jgi:Ca2+-binding EF-hand superfamily protein
MNLAALSDDQLKQFIIQIFQRFDANGDGTLEAPELANFFTQLYKSVGYDIVVTLPMAQQAIRDIDLNGDGKITPYEIYCAFKLMSSQTQTYFQSCLPIEDHKMDV